MQDAGIKSITLQKGHFLRKGINRIAFFYSSFKQIGIKNADYLNGDL